MIRTVFGVIFFINALIFFFQSLSKNIYAPLLPPFMSSFGIGENSAGLLVTLVFMGYALARFPSGVMADKIGCTKTILLGSTTMAFLFMLVGAAPDFYSLAILTFGLGFTSGIYVTAGYTLAVLIGTKGRAATSTALYETFGIIASISSPLLVTVFVLHLGWRFLFVFLGIALLLASTLFFIKRKSSDLYGKSNRLTNNLEQNKIHTSYKKENTLKMIMVELKNSITYVAENREIKKFIIWSTFVGGFGAITWVGTHSFIPTMLVLEKGYEYEIANIMFTLVAVSGLITKIGVGWLGDRYGTRKILLGNLILMAAAIITLAVSENHWILVILMIVLGGTSLNTNTLINSYVLRNMPEHFQGTGFGIFSTSYTLIYSCGPFIIGSLSAYMTIGTAMAFSTIGALTAILLLLFYKLFFPDNKEIKT